MSREFRYKFIFSKKDGLMRGQGRVNDAGSYDMIYFTDYVFDQPETGRTWMFAGYPDAKPYQRTEYKMLTEGSPMPEFTAAIDGKGEIGQSYLNGKPVLMLFWTMGCGASQMAIPLVNKLLDKYPDIEVFALNNEDQDMERITKFVSKYGIRYTVALGNREASLAFGVNGWPTFMVFGKDGKLQFVDMGMSPTTEQTLCEKIEKAIGSN